MLNGIWGFFVIGGIITGAFLGRMDLVTRSVITGGKSALELAFTMAGVVAVWSGILKIAERGGMIDSLAEGTPRAAVHSGKFRRKFFGAGLGGNTCRAHGNEGTAKAEPRQGARNRGNVYVSDGKHVLLAACDSEYSGVPFGIRFRRTCGNCRHRHCRYARDNTCGRRGGENTGREGLKCSFY